jgi:hypothetical protein
MGERGLADGVRLYWDPSTQQEDLYAQLIIGCGWRTERFRSHSVGRLITQLVLSALPPQRVRFGCGVGREAMWFAAEGEPTQVAAFLEQVCATLADLPLHRLTQEAGAVHAETRDERLTTSGVVLSRRYGLTGYGLEFCFGPGTDRIGPEIVHEHAVRHLVRDNAVLVLAGSPPDLRLPLPHGPRPERTVPALLPSAPGPHLVGAEVPVGIGLRGVGARDPVWKLAMAVLAKRIHEGARTERGLNVEVDIDAVTPGPDHAERILWCEFPGDHAGDLSGLLWRTVVELAGAGPTSGELHSALSAEMSALASSDAGMHEIMLAARLDLLGVPFLSAREWMAAAAEVTVHDIRSAMATGLESALLVVPVGAALDDVLWHGEHLPQRQIYSPGERLPEGKVFRPGIAARARSGAARRSGLALTADRIAWRDGDGDLTEIRFSDVVGMAEYDAVRTVVGFSGARIVVDPEEFPGCEEIVRELDRRVPAELRYQGSMFDRESA